MVNRQTYTAWALAEKRAVRRGLYKYDDFVNSVSSYRDVCNTCACGRRHGFDGMPDCYMPMLFSSRRKARDFAKQNNLRLTGFLPDAILYKVAFEVDQKKGGKE